MVASGQKNLLEQRMKVCTLLWDAGIKVSIILSSIYTRKSLNEWSKKQFCL